jgi:hypothetical protein
MRLGTTWSAGIVVPRLLKSTETETTKKKYTVRPTLWGGSLREDESGRNVLSSFDYLSFELLPPITASPLPMSFSFQFFPEEDTTVAPSGTASALPEPNLPECPSREHSVVELVRM